MGSLEGSLPVRPGAATSSLLATGGEAEKESRHQPPGEGGGQHGELQH